jgi:hypothetical protein
MRSIIATLAVLGLATLSSANYIADIGTALGEMNTGMCLAFQDDPTDTTTTCYSTCSDAATSIAAIFDIDSYTDSSFNTAELLDYGQTAMIYILN